ncbi:MAG: UDP-N-acetylmuramate--L-alanine ligase [Clostridia bacterium]|nr:UDP-N-acetylmuramate--L-alanine ligase [Clostridia bacterium]
MKKQLCTDKAFLDAKHIHMIGIGGSGMCPIAELLLSRGYKVTGSDKSENANVKRLRELGVVVYNDHNSNNINGADLVAFSAAVPESNPEMVAAIENNIPKMERSELLGAITRCYDNVIGVSGTHGKTTVSSMITQILLINKQNPNAVIGGKLPIANSSCVVGESETLVCESCEFVDSFLQFSPDITVLLNIDDDHMDYFKTMDNLKNSFKKFVSMGKICYANGDDADVKEVVSDIKSKVITYGFNEDNDYYPQNIKSGKFGYCFDVMKKGIKIGSLEMHAPGKHNVYNGLVSFAVCYEMGVDPMGIAEALSKFTGAGRRFEFIGHSKGITVVDDYAHHPTEMMATLQAAKTLDYKKVIVVFQPYTYSRVALLRDGMIEALSVADKVFMTPIVAAREENIYGVKSEDVTNALPDAQVVADYDELAQKMIACAKEGDLIITMGAGDIFKVAHIILEKLG